MTCRKRFKGFNWFSGFFDVEMDRLDIAVISLYAIYIYIWFKKNKSKKILKRLWCLACRSVSATIINITM